MTKYLSDGTSNTKTAKNKRDTLILYLAPLNQNSHGVNMCPKASDGCAASCLFTAGRGAMITTANARRQKTDAFLSDRKAFLSSVAMQINRRANNVKQLAVRLNGTSDVKLVEQMTSLYAIASNVVFYDYTKIKQKAGRRVLSSGHRYVVTFSRSEVNERDAIDVLNSGGIVAVVFDKIPKLWNGFRVVDGDERDDLMLDVRGAVVLGLKAKGKARHDESGFVVSLFKQTEFNLVN
jgi:hypothetical protein